MTKVTHPMLTRILTGIGLMAAATLSVAASVVPGGALESRAASLRTDEPTTTTTTAPAPPVAAPEAPAAEPAATTTTTAPPATPPVPPAPPARPAARPAATPSGHYTCPAGMDAATQYDAGPDCTADVVADPGPNNTSPNADPTLPNGPDGDQPGQTLGSTDAAYGADLTAKSCAIKPWLCGDGWTH